MSQGRNQGWFLCQYCTGIFGIKKGKSLGGEMAHVLDVLADFTKALSLAPKTWGAQYSSSWDLTASSGLYRHLNSGTHSHRYRQAIKYFF